MVAVALPTHHSHPEVSKADEFMGWASLNPNRFSIYRTFTTWLAGKRNKECSMDARLKGGERAIVCLDEYDRMLPMDIYAEFLLKAIIAFDIDKMEQLGIYEVAPRTLPLPSMPTPQRLSCSASCVRDSTACAPKCHDERTKRLTLTPK